MPETLARRQAVRHLSFRAEAHPHVGLWLDRWVSAHGDDNAAKKAVYRDIIDGPVLADDAYCRAFDRWAAGFADKTRFTCVAVHTTSRLAVGLGADSVLETAIRLHRTYGMPVLPGSALKGLARHHCMKRFGGLGTLVKGHDEKGDPIMLQNPQDLPAEERHRLAFWPMDLIPKEIRGELAAYGCESYTYFDNLFGLQKAAGGIVFHDGWLIPSSFGASPFWPDVMTVHHASYYGGIEKDGDVLPPSDADKPNPIAYVDVMKDAAFLLILEGTACWRDLAIDILARALESDGLGAKTSTGYGRMKKAYRKWLDKKIKDADLQALLHDLLPPDPSEVALAAPIRDWAAEWRQTLPKDGIVGTIYNIIAGMGDQAERRSAALALVDGWRATLRKKWKDNPARKEKFAQILQWAGLESL